MPALSEVATCGERAQAYRCGLRNQCDLCFVRNPCIRYSLCFTQDFPLLLGAVESLCLAARCDLPEYSLR